MLMTQERLFTDEELEAMGARTLDLLQASLEAGDVDTAKKLSRRMYNEFSAMHDLYRDWLTHLFSIVGRKYGDQVLAEALEETVTGFGRRLMSPRYAGKSTRRKVEILLAGLRGHLEPLEVEEDDEKITVTAVNCGSGARQIKEGLYEGPEGFLKIKDPQPMTFGRPDFPVYCAHCYFQNQFSVEPDGEPLFVTQPPENVGREPCRIYVYKK